MLTINKLYQYIFGTHRTANIPHHLAVEQKQKKQERFEKITKEKFKQSIPFYRQKSFRSFLRYLRVSKGLNTSILETILFGNATKKIKMEEFTFPLDNEIQKKFDIYNNRFQYFKENKEIGSAKEQFVIFFKGFKLMADWVEETHSINDEVAYTHAYKALVLFGYTSAKGRKSINPFLNFEIFLKQNYNNQSNRPIHDALIEEIAEKSMLTSSELQSWRGWIVEQGKEAISLFKRANTIKQTLNRSPTSYREAKETATKLTYKRLAENPELAGLLFKYNINEEHFNFCIDELLPKLKMRDDLPSASIDGNDINHRGYHLIKFPINDLNALVLGYLTDCCQSIDGDSRQCIIDGLTKTKNGFYVLLKAKNINIKTNPFIEGKIDYHSYDIVGQGYAWLSEMGNFVFDSWENRRPKADDDIACDFIEAFAKKITTNDHRITRVMIGKGGRTPERFRNKNYTVAEIIAEGQQYDDSFKQSLVYINPEKEKQQKEIFFSRLETLFHQYSAKNILSDTNQTKLKILFSSINTSYLNDYVMNWLRSSFFKQYAEILIEKILIDESDKKKFINLIDSVATENCFSFLSILNHTKITNKINFNTIVDLSNQFFKKSSYLQMLLAFKECSHYTFDKFQLFSTDYCWLRRLSKAYDLLEQNHLLFTEILNVIILDSRNRCDIEDLIQNLIILNSSNLLTSDIISELANVNELSQSVNAIVYLNTLPFSYQQNKKIIKYSIKHKLNSSEADKLNRVLKAMQTFSLATKDNIDWLLMKVKYEDDMSYFYRDGVLSHILKLHKHKKLNGNTLSLIKNLADDNKIKCRSSIYLALILSDILNKKNQNEMLAKLQSYDFSDLNIYFINLFEDGFFDESFFKKILQTPIKYWEKLNSAFNDLSKIQDINKDHYEIIFANPEHCDVIARIISRFLVRDIAFSQVKELVLSNIPESFKFSNSIIILKKYKNLTTENLKLLVDCNLENIEPIMKSLKNLNLLSKENCTLILKNGASDSLKWALSNILEPAHQRCELFSDLEPAHQRCELFSDDEVFCSDAMLKYAIQSKLINNIDDSKLDIVKKIELKLELKKILKNNYLTLYNETQFFDASKKIICKEELIQIRQKLDHFENACEQSTPSRVKNTYAFHYNNVGTLFSRIKPQTGQIAPLLVKENNVDNHSKLII